MTKEQSVLLDDAYQCHLDHYKSVDPDPAWLQQQLLDPQFAIDLKLLWSCSDFAATQAAMDPIAFKALVDSGDLLRSYEVNDYRQALESLLDKECSEQQLIVQLRHFRRREMLRIVWRDFTRRAPMLETTRDATLLAEACINAALAQLHPITVSELGRPVDASGNQQHLLVIAMGKMGAYELNISSDIDLIFVYPDAGQTIDARKSVTNQEFFTRLGQRLIAVLDKHSVDGFVFRVDMRLRPYGQSGGLVMNFAALEEYLLTQGRDWERYAMIKARVVAGDTDAAENLALILQPFVYRKYLDYGSIDALRDLKRSIVREVARKGMQDNIKLGSGGIREVEFIAQTFQLIRGGKNQALQTQSLHSALEVLVEEGLMEPAEQQNLCAAYEFLRNTEHVLQGIADKQTQQLPVDELGQARLTRVMGHTSYEDFYAELTDYRQLVSQSFAAIISAPSTAEDATSSVNDAAIEWLHNPDVEHIHQYLEQLGYEQCQRHADRLMDFYQSKALKVLGDLPRSRLNKLMPMVLQVCVDHSDDTLSRVLTLLEEILRRSAYLALLVENAQALEQLCLLCDRSSWIANELANYPALLDELLDPRTLYTAPEKPFLRDQLRQQTMRVSTDDMEQQMEVIRYFCRSFTLRAAACEVTGVLPLMQVSDYLTWIAEVVVEHVTHVAWDQLQVTYGAPLNNQTSSAQTPGFVVVAYGKMGGLEMGYKSDLDLVFLHNAQPNQVTAGPRSIDASTFFIRLGQRIIHLLSTATASGMAYEIDMRLRPSGNSGLLVSSLVAFEQYQQTQAWTWEHQALVRARAVAGDESLAAAFEAVRKNTLQRKRDVSVLATEVQEMREKMRKHLGQGHKDGKFALKQGSGGIVDIEFMVQFAVLAWSCEKPSIAQWTDTIRILQMLAQEGLLTEQKSQQLVDAYKIYRSAGHRLQLQNQPADVPMSEFIECRNWVISQWQTIFENC